MHISSLRVHVSLLKLLFLWQPFAWEAREFLRKKLIGKEVLFSVEYKVPGTGREYGCIFLQKGTVLNNLLEFKT